MRDQGATMDGREYAQIERRHDGVPRDWQPPYAPSCSPVSGVRTVRQQDTAATPAASNIGVKVDSALPMEQQVTSVCRACYAGLRDVAKIGKHLTEETTNKLIIAFMVSN